MPRTPGTGPSTGSVSEANGRSPTRISRISADAEALADEIVGSKHELEQKLGIPCRYFAWPYGRRADIDQRAAELIETGGYEACFSAVRGSVAPGKTSVFAIPRHHFEPEWPWEHVRFFAAGRHESE